MAIKMIRMVVIDGVRYKPEDAERLGLTQHKALTPEQPIDLPPQDSATPVGMAVEGDVEVVEPSKGGSKVAWVAYAVAQGADEADLEGLSRDKIADAYGS